MAWVEPWDIPVSEVPYKFDLHGIGDWQIGSRSTIEELIDMHIDDILFDAKTRDSGVALLGDLGDEDRPTTRVMRAHIAAERDEVVDRDAKKHVTWLKHAILPRLERLHMGTKFGIMGAVAGHHWTMLPEGISDVEWMLRELEKKTGKRCPYMGEMSGWLDLRFRMAKKSKSATSPASVRKLIHIQHGVGGGQTKSASLNKLDRTTQGFIADGYMRAHDCQLVASKFSQLYPCESKMNPKHPELRPEPKIMAKSIAVLNTGSATQGYEITKKKPAYPEQGMMRPTEMGWGKLTITIRRARDFENVNNNLIGAFNVTI